MPNETTVTADDMRLRIKILCNTIASGEAAEDECYRQIINLVRRLDQTERDARTILRRVNIARELGIA